MRNNWYACKGKSGPVFCSLVARGLIKGRAPGKLTGCEWKLAINLPGCVWLLFLLSFIRKTKNAWLKNPTDLLHKNLMKPLKGVGELTFDIGELTSYLGETTGIHVYTFKSRFHHSETSHQTYFIVLTCGSCIEIIRIQHQLDCGIQLKRTNEYA